MTVRDLWSEDYLIGKAIFISLILHAVFFHLGSFALHMKPRHTVEIDITSMAPAATTPAAPAPAKPASPKKERVKPKPSEKIVPAPLPTKPVAPEPEPSPPAPPAPQEYSLGAGQPNSLSRLPQLLNLSDLRAILRRYYPENARSSGQGATVVLDLHIDTDGEVTSADIVQSGGADFDEAARKAATLLRFSPAFLGSQRVAVKMRQAIQFNLEQ